MEEDKKNDLRGENENFSIGAYSNAFFAKGNSEVYTLNGTLKSRRNPVSENYFPESLATPKDLRKIKQDSFLSEELTRCRKASIGYRYNKGRVPVSRTAKRLIDNFNSKVKDNVGFRSYKGPITFYFFEKFLMDEITKLNVNSSQIFVNPKPFSDCASKFRLAANKSPRKEKLILPKIDSGLKNGDNEYLELRHGGTRKFIKIPRTAANSNQEQISVTFTIKPKQNRKKNFADIEENW